jgi:hypothetical protein
LTERTKSNAQTFTPEYLQLQRINAMTSNSHIVYGDAIPTLLSTGGSSAGAGVDADAATSA